MFKVINNWKGELIKPMPLANQKKIPENFLHIYSYFISNGLMDSKSFAGCKVTDEPDFNRLSSVNCSDHSYNMVNGMAIGLKKDDGEQIMTCPMKENLWQSNIKVQNKFLNLNCDSVICFKSPLKLSKSRVKYDKSKNKYSYMPNTNVPRLKDPLKVSEFGKIIDEKKFYFIGYDDKYGIIGFSKDWETNQIINIVKRYWNIKEKSKMVA